MASKLWVQEPDTFFWGTDKEISEKWNLAFCTKNTFFGVNFVFGTHAFRGNISEWGQPGRKPHNFCFPVIQSKNNCFQIKNEKEFQKFRSGKIIVQCQHVLCRHIQQPVTSVKSEQQEWVSWWQGQASNGLVRFTDPLADWSDFWLKGTLSSNDQTRVQ